MRLNGGYNFYLAHTKNYIEKGALNVILFLKRKKNKKNKIKN